MVILSEIGAPQSISHNNGNKFESEKFVQTGNGFILDKWKANV